MKTFTLLKSLNKGYTKYSFFTTLLLLCTSSFAQIIMNAPTLTPARWEAKLELFPVDNVTGLPKFIRIPVLFTNPDTTRVGIGTNTPLAKLDLRGTLRLGTLTNNIAWQFREENITGVGPCMIFENINPNTSLSKNFVFRTTGNIGIGTDIPEAKLDVNGNLIIRGKINAKSISLSGDINANSLSLRDGITAADLSLSNNLTTNNLTVTGVFSASNVSFSGNMNVSEINVTKFVSVDSLHAGRILQAGNSITIGNITNAGNDEIKATSGNINFLKTNLIMDNAWFLQGKRNDGSAGNLIGVNSGFNVIEIGAPNSFAREVRIFTPLDAGQGVSIKNTHNDNTKPIAFFRNDGNVGIGTSTPARQLHIAGQSPGIFLDDNQIQAGTSGETQFTISADNGVGRLITNQSVSVFINGDNNEENNFFSVINNSSFFGGSAKTLFNINENGNVDICGSIRAKGIKINVEWCDFVFDKNYNLLTIPQLKTFIEQNGHLPNYPSGKEIEEQGGVEVSQSITWLLQSDEETKLYLIQIYEEMQQLRKENEVMKKQIEELQK